MADSTVPAPAYSLGRRLIAEVFGTFMLVFGVIGAALFISAEHRRRSAVALAVGLAVLDGRLRRRPHLRRPLQPRRDARRRGGRSLPSGRDVFPYILAQIVGGILATSVLLWISVASEGGFTADFAARLERMGRALPGRLRLLVGRRSSRSSSPRSSSGSSSG